MSKEYNPAMHTAEHILNAVMTELKGVRSFSNHIEKKKSKCDFRLGESLGEDELALIEQKVNAAIDLNMDITYYSITASEAVSRFDLGKLPESAGDSIRIVKIGDFNEYPCIGDHVENTKSIGRFKFVSSVFNEGVMRVRFTLESLE